MTDREHMIRHSSDIDRLQRLAFANGVAASPKEVYKAWAAHSEASAAGWLCLYDEPEHNWSAIASDLRDTPSQFDACEILQEDLDRIAGVARDNGYDLNRVEAFAAWDQASRNQMREWASLSGYEAEIWAELQPILQSEA